MADEADPARRGDPELAGRERGDATQVVRLGGGGRTGRAGKGACVVRAAQLASGDSGASEALEGREHAQP
jgi:hypothetical protein